MICVVEDPLDVLALERTRSFRGLYHVLHGVISPINGIGPDQIKLKELFARLDDPEVTELVIATNPTLEGEATAMYIRRHPTRQNLRITHLARGLPVGGTLEYTDETTLTRAFQGRQEL
jgi:recombination protein RecR